jgi:cytoskeleton protein RodZ
MTESIGEMLREARHNKKASLEDAARATKIKIDTLEKLESDDFQALPAAAYTKGFLKLYAEYLGLDPAVVGEAYLKSQGGLRRQGLHVETEVQIRARKPRELQLPIAAVVRIVAALTLVIIMVMVGHHFWTRRSHSTPAKPAALPAANFEAYYQPKAKPAPETLDPSGK